MTKNAPSPIFSLTLLVALALAAPAFSADPPPVLPKNGVCGVIGAAKVEPWMIDLAKSGNVVVHCLVADETAVQRFGQAVDRAGVGGKLTFEAIPASPLPYRDQLLNGLVILAAPDGFNRDSALRAVAPGGSLSILENGAWKTTPRTRPDGMDQWTHVYRDAGGNSGVSTDRHVKFPLGLRWNDDLPFNLRTNQEHSNAWTNTRAIAVVDGRVYYVTNCARENLKRTAAEMAASDETQDMYLIARDAWNGTQLWRKKLGPIFYGGLFYTARAPMVAADGKVWAVNKEAQLLEIDGATGETLRTFQTKHIAAHLMLIDGVLVAATWKDGDDVGAKTGIDRRPMDIAITEGTVEAFDLASGKKLWSVDRLATSLRGADGRVYLVHRDGTDEYEIEKAMKAKRRGGDAEKPASRGNQMVMAFGLRDGKDLWSLDSVALGAGASDHLAAGVAGLGGLAVSVNTYAITSTEDSSAREAIWLDGASGKVLVRKANAGFPVLHEGNVHLGGQAFVPATGEPADGVTGVAVGVTVCTPQVYVNGITTQNRSNKYRVDGQSKTFGAARGSCMFAAIPANGAFYTAQTYCACAPGTAPGFISFGPVGTEPSAEEVEKGSRLFKGPAYGRQTGSGADGWSTFMGNAERSNANPTAQVPAGKMKIEWQSRIAQPMTETNIEGSWKDSLAGLVTAPVASGGHVFAADLHRRKVMMFGAADGKLVWERHVGGRVTTPPTIDGDLCLFGAADGYVYALDKTDGALAYKLRVAPEDRRMVSHAQLESPWSAFSSVLVGPDGVAYASAGRSTGAESGIVVRAFTVATGEVLWSRDIAYREGQRGDHVNDAMYLAGDRLFLMKSVLDRKSGDDAVDPWAEHDKELAAWRIAASTAVRDGQPIPPQPERPGGLPMRVGGIEGLANPNWTKLGDRRRKASSFEDATGQILAWDDSTLVSPVQVIDRKEAKPLPVQAGLGEQITGLALGKNAVVYGGGHYPKEGGSGGFVRAIDRVTGKVLAEHRFAAPLAYQGLAIADGKIYATFEDGSLVCIGAE